jgi:hypothetical protein
MEIFISTPCYGGLCLKEYASSILELIKLTGPYGFSFVLDITENESLVQRARNVSIARFLYKSTCDYFMFIDADIHFDPMSVVRLLQAGHDISVAAYPKKGIMWDDVEKGILAGDQRSPELLSAAIVLNFGKEKIAVNNGFCEVFDGPTGFMMIKRKVIEDMYKQYPELNCVNDHMNKDLDTYCAIFDCMIDPESKRYLSEDYAFCRRWQQMGGKIHADVTATLGHVGNIRFSGCIGKS